MGRLRKSLCVSHISPRAIYGVSAARRKCHFGGVKLILLHCRTNGFARPNCHFRTAERVLSAAKRKILAVARCRFCPAKAMFAPADFLFRKFSREFFRSAIYAFRQIACILPSAQGGKRGSTPHTFYIYIQQSTNRPDAPAPWKKREATVRTFGKKDVTLLAQMPMRNGNGHRPPQPLTRTDNTAPHMTTQEFIDAHRTDDTRMLALKYQKADDVDIALALRQIAGWQVARRKIPTWAACRQLLYPVHLSMEQCSSEATARYKAQVMVRLMAGAGLQGSQCKLTDLTGGFGVDFAFMAASVDGNATYVEADGQLCLVARHNMPLLGLPQAEVCHDAAENHLEAMPPSTFIFVDPARRDAHGARTYAMADCTPDVLRLMPTLLQKARWLMLKLSPMLDITQAVAEVEAAGQARVAEVHVVATAGECKELLLVVTRRGGEATAQGCTLYCDNDGLTFSTPHATHRRDDMATPPTHSAPLWEGQNLPGAWLYVPNAAIMKAGCFGALAEAFALQQLDRNSHLFVALQPKDHFPGRRFVVQAATTMNKQSVRRLTQGLQCANVAVRNFPLSAEQLRKRLRLADGGDAYVFGTTVRGTHMLLLCRKQ